MIKVKELNTKKYWSEYEQYKDKLTKDIEVAEQDIESFRKENQELIDAYNKFDAELTNKQNDVYNLKYNVQTFQNLIGKYIRVIETNGEHIEYYMYIHVDKIEDSRSRSLDIKGDVILTNRQKTKYVFRSQSINEFPYYYFNDEEYGHVDLIEQEEYEKLKKKAVKDKVLWLMIIRTEYMDKPEMLDDKVAYNNYKQWMDNLGI